MLVLLTLFIVQNLVNSRSGRAITATRDNRIAAESVGIDVTKFKLLAFTVSAALAGVAGVLYAHNLSMLKVSGFDYNMSISICDMLYLVELEIFVVLLLQQLFCMHFRNCSEDLQTIVC